MLTLPLRGVRAYIETAGDDESPSPLPPHDLKNHASYRKAVKSNIYPQTSSTEGSEVVFRSGRNAGQRLSKRLNFSKNDRLFPKIGDISESILGTVNPKTVIGSQQRVPATHNTRFELK